MGLCLYIHSYLPYPNLSSVFSRFDTSELPDSIDTEILTAELRIYKEAVPVLDRSVYQVLRHKYSNQSIVGYFRTVLRFYLQAQNRPTIINRHSSLSTQTKVYR